MSPRPADPEIRAALVGAATTLFLTKGYCDTRIDEVCAQAGRSKGSFFHYFANKEALAAAVLQAWLERGSEAYRDAPFWQLRDPVRRVIGYVDYTGELLAAAAVKGCMVGMLSQELAQTHPRLRRALGEAFEGWGAHLEQMLAEVRGVRRVPGGARALAYHFMAIYEGALILGKALREPSIVKSQLAVFNHFIATLA